MIFVTVGTHQQPFGRLLDEVDRLVEAGAITEEVFCQSGGGRSPRVPSAPLLPYEEMQRRLRSASLVVSHGGPGTVMSALAAERPLVLVPRRRAFGEHVDDHQVRFCRLVGARNGVPVVEDIADLAGAIGRARATPPRRGAAHGEIPEGVANLGRIIGELLRAR